ncbi:MAG: histidine kinase [Desulfovibrio sp.]|jgi:signal transduction histidine kinase|nr:histidine kinase [Desulfovibrio sp.]
MDGRKDTREVKEMLKAAASAFSGSDPADRDLLAKIVELLPCYVVLVDREHRVIFHNAAFATFFGEQKGNFCYAAMRGQSKPCRVCPPLRHLTRKGASVMEWVQQASGLAFRVHSYPFADAAGHRCVLKAGFNITTNLRMKQALDLSEQSYRAITDNLSIGVALMDTSLRVKAGNIRLGQWFGSSFRLEDRVCGMARCGAEHELAHADETHYCPDCPFHASLQDGQGHEKEYSSFFQEGGERMLRLVTCPVKPARPGQTRVRAMIMMLEDITGRLRLSQQLQRSRKVEALNALAGGIAHEINQPLSALHLYVGGLQLLLEKNKNLPAAVTRERLNYIMREADKIRSIIANMRDLVKKEGGSPLTAVSLAGAVDGVLAIMKRRAVLRKVRVSVDVPVSLPSVLSNEVQLEQVLVNLLSNAMYALDSVPESGRGERRILIRGSCLPETRRVRLEVADSGPGLTLGTERIFDPFYTTREGHGGMGLGLSIVYGLVTLWGGEIGVVQHHRELGGAAFLLDLPQAGERDGEVESVSSESANPDDGEESGGPGDVN